jgi:hypothetical protein
MANAVSGTPLPGGTPPVGEHKPSHGPPPAPKRRSDQPPAPPTAATIAAAQAAHAAQAAAERRAEYVPAPPRAPVELPKIPKLEVMDTVQVSGQGSVPPPAVAASAPPARTSSVPPPPPGPREARTSPPSGHAPTQRRARSLGAVTRIGEELRARLPLAVRERIEGVPAGGLLVGGGLLAVLVLAAAGLTARTAYRAATDGRSDAPSKAAEAAPAATSGEEKAESVENAPAAAPPNPVVAGDEATVLLDLGEQLLAQKRTAEVPPLVARLIARDPGKKDDARVGKILLSAAGSDDRKAAADAHALLTGPMGETGATLVYELSVASGVRDGIRTRAQTWLASKEFERVASLPIFAAQKLRAAKTCEDKHALLDFAERAGGKHALEYLKEVERKKACAPDDLEHCYPCMRNDNKLSEVVASLEKRL